jgi:hypothetical protein
LRRRLSRSASEVTQQSLLLKYLRMKLAVTIAMSSKAILAMALVSGLIAPSFAQMKLRDEQISRQKEGGYGLADFSYGSVRVADFTRQGAWSEERLPSPADKIQFGLLSPDGTMIALSFPNNTGKGAPYLLGIVRRDGSGLREYASASYVSCWSPDHKRLIVPKHLPKITYPSMLLDVESGEVEEIGLPPRAELSSQCWSPDGQRLVYHVLDRAPIPWTIENSKKKEPPNLGTVFIYDIAQMKSHEVGRGQEPTWSPDGEWIAYWNNGAYYRIPPSGGEPERLLKNKEPRSPLLWSPDSRLVLYFRCCYLRPSLQCMCDVGRWFVRRLADHSEIRVAEESPFAGTYVWIKNPTRPGS